MSSRFNLEVLSFGRAGDAPPQSCKLELTGRHLLYDVTLDGGFIFISAQVCNRGDLPSCWFPFPMVPKVGKTLAD